MSEHHLEVRRMLCPMPVIRAQEKVSQLQPDDILIVTCTDPGALNDIPMWCRINGHEVLKTETIDNDVVITLKVGSDE